MTFLARLLVVVVTFPSATALVAGAAASPRRFCRAAVVASEDAVSRIDETIGEIYLLGRRFGPSGARLLACLLPSATTCVSLE